MAVKEVSESAMVMLVVEASQHLLNNVVREGGSDDLLIRRQEAMGFRIGVAVTERLMRDKPLMKLSRRDEPKELVRLLCREFWPYAFNKQMDGLRMNKQGDVFIVRANNFKYLQHISCGQMQLYAPGTRGVLAKEVTLDGRTFPVGSKILLTKQLTLGSGSKSVVHAADDATFEAMVEGNLVTVDLDDIWVDTPPRLNPNALLHMPAGMLRGAMYALGVVAAVEPQRKDDDSAEFTITTRANRLA
eukprot:TRINITY_DN7018_c0_g4_i1.p2 TRINITY_DN7018_c0_g4~~TRINITY_DN7018_c0_g4_i1.p2  ORF type:complete len:245 (+),score=61.70 TRINITY_DN7018_c0_g4_i1:353-1087(+)